MKTLRAEADNVAGLSESGDSTPAKRNWTRATANRIRPEGVLPEGHGGSPDSENPATSAQLLAHAVN